MKKIISLNGWSLITIGIIGGLLSLLIYDLIWRLLIILIGIGVLLIGIAYLTFTINVKNYKQEKTVETAIKSALFILTGVLLIIPWTSYLVQLIVGLVVGLYLLLTCLIRLFKAEDKKLQFKKDIIKYVFAALVIVLGIQDSGKYIALGFFIFVLVLGIISVSVEYKESKKITNSSSHVDIDNTEYHVDDQED